MLALVRSRDAGRNIFADGISWTFAGQAYGSDIHYDDGSTSQIGRRERPQVLTINGTPALLFTGVQPKSGLSFTMVEPIAQA